MIIKSSKSLCNNYDEFSKLAHSTDEPIFITKDGEGDIVILSIELYNKISSYADSTETLNQHHKEKNMTAFYLGNVLKEMYNSSPRGQQVTNIHTFAIYFANVIERERINKKEILKVAGLPESYQTEISKGINLASYVDVKESQVRRILDIETNLK